MLLLTVRVEAPGCRHVNQAPAFGKAGRGLYGERIGSVPVSQKVCKVWARHCDRYLISACQERQRGHMVVYKARSLDKRYLKACEASVRPVQVHAVLGVERDPKRGPLQAIKGFISNPDRERLACLEKC